MGNFFSTREKNSTSVTSVTFIASFHRHVIKNKIRDQSINEVKNLGYYG